MITNASLATKAVEEHSAFAAARGLGSSGNATIKALRDVGLPSSRDENWKYANLRPLERARFTPVNAKAKISVSSVELPGSVAGYQRHTFLDGIYAPELSASRELPGIRVELLRGLQEASDPASIHPDSRFALLNSAFSTEGLAITVEPGTDCATCVELVFIATADAEVAASYPHVKLNIESRAKFGLIERHIHLGSAANFVNAAIEVNVAAGAHIDHFRLQQAGARASWIDTLSATLQEDSSYQIYLMNLGALSARSTMHVRLQGVRAELGLHSVSVADGQQVHDAVALVDHAAPDTQSRQSFRGIAGGRSRSAFNSKVVVREGSKGANSYQSLRGLLAGEHAEIDVRPQLEIFTDDVRCAHGATAGKLDDAMLFYLLSRGIEREIAQRLLKWAFLEDVVAKIKVPELRRQVERALAGQLSESPELEELL